MKLRNLDYWIPTAIFSLGMVGGGLANLSQSPEVVANLGRLGYPPLLGSILGAWKLAGVVALLAPGLVRLKEWAYAGYFFLLTGAFVSHVAADDPAGQTMPSVVLLTFLLISWARRPAQRVLGELKLPGTATHSAPATARAAG
ncbi:MAG: DoxX family protein [Deltaproteobacteria bacterium]|nr:DoxX family protein [Deltaproteobacteria bacterium]